MHFIGGEDGLTTGVIAHFQHFEPGPVIIYQAEQPVVAVMTDFPLGIPFWQKLAAIFVAEGLRLVLAEVIRIEQLPVEVLAFELVPIDQSDVAGFFEQTEGGDDGRANAATADDVVHIDSFRDAASNLPGWLVGLVFNW